MLFLKLLGVDHTVNQSGPQNVTLSSSASALPGICIKCRFSGPAPVLVSQELFGDWGPDTVGLTSPRGDSGIHSSMRTTGLKDTVNTFFNG